MSLQRKIPVIGVVGGIGSGKSFFAQTLAKQKNVVIVDADVVGHRLLLRPEIRQRIRERFGDEVFAADGSIQRRSLAKMVFGDSPEQVRSKADLEAIVHPPLAAELQQQITAAQAAGCADAIILDAAILLEAGWRDFCDAVVMIEVSPEIRLQRVQANRGWTEAEFRAREGNQLSVEQKRAAADYVVVNNGNRDSAAEKNGPENEKPGDELTQRCLQVFKCIMNSTH
ncbi:MAG: Dephospho-CoA kinase [Planctomycetaceae bacterium]|nr:Dephospho-CoA kinase [Planctomycetaceae bacterium]